MGKTLVAYFSAGGVTRPAVPYTRADLDWTDKNSRSSVEMRDPSSRPAIAEKLGNMDDYDTVFLGFPKMEQGYICV